MSKCFPGTKVKGHECPQRSQEVIVLATCCIFMHFMGRKIRTLRTNMTIVFPFPAMGVAALARGLDGHWGLKSQKGAGTWMEKMRKVIGV